MRRTASSCSAVAPLTVVYVTATLPSESSSESFFLPEIAELENRGVRVIRAPRHSSGGSMATTNVITGSMLSPHVLWCSLQEAITNPKRVFGVVWRILRSGSLTTKLKNAAVIPRGIYIGTVAKQVKANHIHAQWASTTATIALIAHEVSGTTWSFTAHRGDIVLSNLFQAKVNTASFVRFISESSIALSERVNGRCDPSRQRLIHMGVCVPDRVAGVQRSRRRHTLLCAASLFPVKGHCHLIRAMQLLRERGVQCRLTLAGSGQLRGQLGRLVTGLKLQDRIAFAGDVPREQLLSSYQAGDVDVVVLASVDLGNGIHEGIPVALMEAMAHGIPVVATSTGGIPELLRDGAGSVVPPGDSRALADAIERLLLDDELYCRIASAGRARVRTEFNATSTAALLHDEILDAVGAAKRLEVLSI